MFDTDDPALTGTWVPITEELVIEDLGIEGTVPDDLVGTLSRNSSDQWSAPLNQDSCHIIDGDGAVMLPMGGDHAAGVDELVRSAPHLTRVG
jgi:carotenoid cleavage dioxygenase